ncbi:unnamed protein product [Nippostrongylus brasiliensis]|uniref:39S ribosomal protein L39, mitochondrial (inferred by orthology to a human protein) n=1 Tax=Nippostrongylus brasiliensis TaxID=27835 RepID=A0A0N4YB64_NIPBR|nr:unnamed protein product [Nippostrongylus brasiliensis]
MIRSLSRVLLLPSKRCASTSKAAVAPISKAEISSELFDDVQRRVRQHGQTVEKVIITFNGKDGTKKEFLMNKNLSSPYDCAKHINMLLAKRAAVAIVSYPGEDARIESMNEPFRDQCEFELVDFQTELYSKAVNKAYWRSCSVALAAALTKALAGDIAVSRPHSEVEQCYFAADVSGLKCDVLPEHLKEINAFLRADLIIKAIPFESVTLPSELAPDYGFTSRVRLCRLGEFVAEVDGPVISRSDQIGRFSIVKALAKDSFTRFGAVSLPSSLKCSSYSWNMILDNAKDKIS